MSVTLQYGVYTLISRPHFDDKLRLWLANTSISRSDRKFYYHQLSDFAQTFETEEEALAFGFSAARLWIDKHEGE